MIAGETIGAILTTVCMFPLYPSTVAYLAADSSGSPSPAAVTSAQPMFAPRSGQGGEVAYVIPNVARRTLGATFRPVSTSTIRRPSRTS